MQYIFCICKFCVEHFIIVEQKLYFYIFLFTWSFAIRAKNKNKINIDTILTMFTVQSVNICSDSWVRMYNSHFVGKTSNRYLSMVI